MLHDVSNIVVNCLIFYSVCTISIVWCGADRLVCQLLQLQRTATRNKRVMAGRCLSPSKQNQIFLTAFRRDGTHADRHRTLVGTGKVRESNQLRIEQARLMKTRCLRLRESEHSISSVDCSATMNARQFL